MTKASIKKKVGKLKLKGAPRTGDEKAGKLKAIKAAKVF
jgi:hypothetical protein